mgnify:CR=1 FL=1
MVKGKASRAEPRAALSGPGGPSARVRRCPLRSAHVTDRPPAARSITDSLVFDERPSAAAAGARAAERRAELKRASVNPHLSQDERDEAMAALHALPRDASPTRLRRRDVVDGRPRGHLRVTGTSRVRFREMALRGELPGIVKSSW